MSHFRVFVFLEQNTVTVLDKIIAVQIRRYTVKTLKTLNSSVNCSGQTANLDQPAP